VGTGALSDALAARAAAAAGSGLVDERARAVGLHQALYVVPLLSAFLAAVLWAASRAVKRDRAVLRDWISLNTQGLDSSP
jgi:hypothetical protein